MSRQHYRPSSYRARSSIGYLVKRAYAVLVDGVEPLFSQHGLTFMQWVVLVYLRDGVARSPKDFCEEFRHDSGALTRVIDQLEKRGCVQRRRSSADRRAVELLLTAEGRGLVELVVPRIVDRLNRVLADFSAAEVSEFKRLLNKLIDGATAVAVKDGTP